MPGLLAPPQPGSHSSSSHTLRATITVLGGTDFPSQASFGAGLFALQCFRNTQLSLSQWVILSEEEKEGTKERGKLAKQHERRRAEAQHAPWGAAALLCVQQRGQTAAAPVWFCTLRNTYMHTNKVQHACWPRKPNPVHLLSPCYSMQPKLALHLWAVVHFAVQVLFHVWYTHHPTSLIPQPCPTLALVSSLHERPGLGFPLLSAVNAAVLVGKKRCKAGTHTAVKG